MAYPSNMNQPGLQTFFGSRKSGIVSGDLIEKYSIFPSWNSRRQPTSFPGFSHLTAPWSMICRRHRYQEKITWNTPIAHCRNVRELGRVSYIDYIENLNISTEMILNDKLPSHPKFNSFQRKNVQMGASQKLQNSIQILIILWLVHPIHTNSLF